MSNEIHAVYSTGRSLYALVRNTVGQIWNGTAFEAYVTANYATYPVSLVQQGTSESFYAGTFPVAISAGHYDIVVKNQVGVSTAETDPAVAMGEIEWNGTRALPLSDLVTSGQISQHLPIVAYYGQMIRPFTFKLVSAADSRSPFTSGAGGLSGQISRDGGAFGPLQSGAFTEMGLGWYSLQALTSGDMSAKAVSLNFKSLVSGIGESDPRDFAMILQ